MTTYVVCSGLIYGQEENLFHYLFKAGWHNEPDLPVYGNGKNILPSIHINDLAGYVCVKDFEKKGRFTFFRFLELFKILLTKNQKLDIC